MVNDVNKFYILEYGSPGMILTASAFLGRRGASPGAGPSQE